MSNYNLQEIKEKLDNDIITVADIPEECLLDIYSMYSDEVEELKDKIKDLDTEIDRYKLRIRKNLDELKRINKVAKIKNEEENKY